MRRRILFSISILTFFLIAGCSEQQAISNTTIGTDPTLATKSLSIGQTLPNFSLPLLSDPRQLNELSSFRGKVLYIDFWASWCHPCRQSMPLLNTLRNELKQAGFEVLAINFDQDISMARSFLASTTIDYPLLANGSEELMERYKVSGLPTAFLVDKEGILRHIHLGFKLSDIDFLRAEIKKLLVAPTEPNNAPSATSTQLTLN